MQIWWQRRHERLREECRKTEQALEAARKQHYQEISRIEAEQQALFNSMSEGVLILDQTGRVQLVNRSLLGFFGLKVDVRGRTIMEAFRLPELVEVARRLPQERIVEGVELELPGVNGGWLEAVPPNKYCPLEGSLVLAAETTWLINWFTSSA